MKAIEILLKQLEINQNRIEWERNHQFKILYYSLLLFIVAIAFRITSPEIPIPEYLYEDPPFGINAVQVFMLLIGATAVIQLGISYGNEFRFYKEHQRLNQMLGKIAPKIRSIQPLFVKEIPDWSWFWLSRAYYMLAVVFLVMGNLIAWHVE